MEDKCDFGKTSKGKDTACFKKFEYYNHKENKDSSIRWRCREYQREKCKIFINTLGNCVSSLPYLEHSHFPDGNGIEARVAEMKDLITGIRATPLTVIGSQSQILSSKTIGITKETKSSTYPTTSYEEFGYPRSFTKLYRFLSS